MWFESDDHQETDIQQQKVENGIYSKITALLSVWSQSAEWAGLQSKHPPEHEQENTGYN